MLSFRLKSINTFLPLKAAHQLQCLDVLSELFKDVNIAHYGNENFISKITIMMYPLTLHGRSFLSYQFMNATLEN